MNKAFEKILERLQIPYEEHGDTTEHYKEYVEKIVQEVAEEHNGGWIPCDERYPTDDSYILLSFDNFSVPCVGRYEADETGGNFYIGDEDETCVSQDLYVNAWQPLPKPYKEAENE